MRMKISDIAPNYWKATHPDWDPMAPNEWTLPECPRERDEGNLFSLFEQHQDGSWWYHPGWTKESKEELQKFYEEKLDSDLWKDRPMKGIIHKHPFKQDRSVCTFDFETFREVSGYAFKFDEEGKEVEV